MTDIPTKDEVAKVYEQMSEMFLEGIKDELKSHMNDNHTFMYGKNKSVWRATEKLSISKELAIYILMGSNRRQESWGTLNEKFDMEPLRKVLTPKIVEMCREVESSNYYQVSFTDRDKLDGNFKLKIEMKPLGKKSFSKPDSRSVDEDGFKRVKTRVPKMTLRDVVVRANTAPRPAIKKSEQSAKNDELSILRARVAALEAQLKN
jgi:hypothetical protein